MKEKINKILKEIKEEKNNIIVIDKAPLLPELDLDKFKDKLVKKAFILFTKSSE